MEIRTISHKKFVTKDDDGAANGFLVPLYNIHEKFFAAGKDPQQVYLTTVLPGKIKGPHLHFIRTGFFTCIKGNVRVILKIDGEYQTFFSGEDHEYRSIEVPTGIPAAVECLGDEEAYLLNMPNPAWTPEMNDEHTADFSDFDYNS
ncbi:MAG TPA: WxcM-like domain-containing protein [Pyrinomonadaceae bacterium]|jgi:dTDP-4-dehydrorhamnose 3,5-epimerase|nr:WxcM-like domain-containing protein [Pyrinomonadaceae bacterium]